MPRMQPLTHEEHLAIGTFLREARHEWIAMSVAVQNAYPQSSRAYKAAKELLEAFDQAKNHIEDQFFVDCPDEADTAVYYGRPHYADAEREQERASGGTFPLGFRHRDTSVAESPADSTLVRGDDPSHRDR